MSTSSCCPSRPCVVFLACLHLELFNALSLSPGIFLVYSWCDHSMQASLLWRCLTVPSTPTLLRTHSFVFLAVRETPQILSQSFHLKGVIRVSPFFLRVQLSHLYVTEGHTRAVISRILVEIGMLWLSRFSPVMPRSLALCLTWYGIEGPKVRERILYTRI